MNNNLERILSLLHFLVFFGPIKFDAIPGICLMKVGLLPFEYE